jgi:hypothetical protein
MSIGTGNIILAKDLTNGWSTKEDSEGVEEKEGQRRPKNKFQESDNRKIRRRTNNNVDHLN